MSFDRMLGGGYSECLIQSSPGGTGSTVLANALKGSYGPNDAIVCSGPASICSSASTTVIKTHKNHDEWRVLNPTSNVIIVGTDRDGKKTKGADVIFKYDELSNPQPNSTREVCQCIADRLDPVVSEIGKCRSMH